MDLRTDNKIRIDAYIQNQHDAYIDTFPISLKGERKNLHVYRLPTDMLFYNIRNGRFAAEYKDLEKTEGGALRSENPDDATKIKQLLLNLDKTETDRTMNDLSIRGQWNYGIITQDGYVIDGNRRMAIISKLYDETGLERWKYLNVARLESPISPEDLWKLEAGIQLGKDEIVRYGPVNELLKIREGIEAGLTEKTIANSLYGYSEDEITNKLNLLKLIDDYLKIVGIPQKYSEIKNRVEHFINLQQIIIQCKKNGYVPDKIIKIKYVVFQLISEDIPHLELRKIRDMIRKDLTDAITEIEVAGSQLKPTIPPASSFQEESKKEKQEMSQTYTHFINAKDILDVSNNEGKEILLLNRAEKNLRPLLDYSGQLSPEAITMIKKIGECVKQLQKKFGE